MTQNLDFGSNLDALREKSKQSRQITSRYYNESEIRKLGDLLCRYWAELLQQSSTRAVWLDWAKAAPTSREFFIKEALRFLSEKFGLGELPVRFLPFIPAQTPAAEFSPDGFVFYGQLSESVITGQITHEFVHALQSNGRSAIPITALLMAYTLYITPVRASATDKTAEFVRTAFESLLSLAPDEDRAMLNRAYDDYVFEGPMFAHFGINPTDEEREVIRELYSNSIIEKEAIYIGDYVRMKLSDMLYAARLNLWN